jgi:hypothetical protein
MSREGPIPPAPFPGAAETPSTSAETPPPAAPRRGRFWKGFGLGCLLHLFQILAFGQPFLLTLWGLTQFVYQIPAGIHFRKRGEPDTVKGIMVAAAVSFLLNAACWGLFFGIAGDWR